MRFKELTLAIASAFVATLVLPIPTAAQHTNYKLIEIPTFGGPSAMGQADGPGISQFINSSGVVVGGADTTAPDPYCLNPDCFLPHAFRWQDGVLTDLGSLQGTNFSHATSINRHGWATGGSFTSHLDPLTAQPAEHAVLWKDAKIIDLGTLGTGLESAGLYVNDAGEVVGFSTFDTTPDPSSFKGATIHAFIWRNGVMRDLGTLGGPGASPAGGCNNQHPGLVAGTSSTESGESHAFLWNNGTMTDIPTLGGTSAVAQCANNQGEVIGQSNVAGDVDFHAFSWHQGMLVDLGTLGGSSSLAFWLNNSDEAVGAANTRDDESFHATLWKNGHVSDLGTLDGDCFSLANSINANGLIIGQSFSCDFVPRAVLWDRGSIIDLNAAIQPSSSLQLMEPFNINDRGQIVGRGLPAGCDNLDLCGRAFVLIPCDSAEAQGCQQLTGVTAQPRSVTSIGGARINPPDPQKIKEFVGRLRDRRVNQYQVSGHRTP